jgi:hypothetical protein
MNCGRTLIAIGTAATILVLLRVQSDAADAAGRFVTGGGVGELSCVEFVSAMEKARRYTYRSVEYWKSIDAYVSYVAGFQTGFNYGWEGRQDIFENLQSRMFSAGSRLPAAKIQRKSFIKL